MFLEYRDKCPLNGLRQIQSNPCLDVDAAVGVVVVGVVVVNMSEC